MITRRRSKYAVPLTLGALVVLIDQICKWAVERFMPFQVKYDIVPSFALFRTWNEGIAFSMFAGLGATPLIVIALVVCAFVIWLWYDSPFNRRLSHFGFALVIGGAVGNLVDRFRFGHVVDYFLFYIQDWSFAVFNFADAAISIGAGLVLLDEALAWWRHYKSKKPGDTDKGEQT